MNVLIKASAGTGKTFALATHAIRLLLVGTPPRAIVALTFSRAAAGEIFNRIAERLAEAAADDAGARKETGDVVKELDPAWERAIWQTWEPQGLVESGPGGRSLSRKVFARLLRDYIHDQHVSRIGTIDSFMAQMVKSFPVELGLQGAMTIMDDFEALRQKTAAADALLAAAGGDGDAQTLIDEFRLATVGKEAKRFSDSLDQFVKRYHETYQRFPQAERWGNPLAMWGASGVPFRHLRPLGDFADRIEAQIIAKLPPDDARRDKAGWPAVVAFVRGFDGAFTEMPTPLDNIIKAWSGAGDDLEFKCNRVATVLAGEDARLVTECVEALFNIALCIRCGRTQGVFRLMARLDGVYARNTRQRGLLTFSDIPRLIGQLGEVPRMNLEYRFDSELRHWALDEFQDTSREQWEAIRNLVDEAKADAGRAVFVVGDMKQAIYGWRGGDVAILEGEAASKCYQVLSRDQSRRFCQEIAEFVNRVFDGDKMAAYLESGAAGAGEKWRRLWVTHESAVSGKGCVTAARVREAERNAEKPWEPFVEPIRDELLRVRPWERGISSALLVRTNEQGEAFADALRKAGVRAIWEGESDIADTPVVQSFLNLLRFVEHPDDTQAWEHVCAGPLITAPPFAGLRRGRAGRDLKEEVLAKVTSDVSRLGLARTLRDYADAVRETFDAFTLSRVDGLIRAASQFAAVADAGMSLTDFADYVTSFKTRAAADTSVVKILTVHRSKGLGFDYVIVPIIDSQAITVLNNQRTFHAPDWAWLLDQPPVGKIIERDDTLSMANRAEVEDSVFEDLCAYYVSMTRAKRAMSVYLRTGGKELNFSNQVEKALGQPCPFVLGDPAWFAGAAREEEKKDAAALPRIARRPRVAVRRATPSALAHAGVSASVLFDVRDAGAAERGTQIHELMSKIEWLDGGLDSREAAAACEKIGIDLAQPSAFREALTRPAGVVEVWRERSFEMLVDGLWTSGTFDRVVFVRQSGELAAAIYDYKSNSRRDGESVPAFEARMREAYAPQMAAYCQAVSKLAGLDARSIRASLLLTATLSCVPVV